MKYADGSATIKFEGGPIDGETHFLTPSQYRHGRAAEIQFFGEECPKC